MKTTKSDINLVNETKKIQPEMKFLTFLPSEEISEINNKRYEVK